MKMAGELQAQDEEESGVPNYMAKGTNNRNFD
jgi:hypothetical protein